MSGGLTYVSKNASLILKYLDTLYDCVAVDNRNFRVDCKV
jgi:hypothetical protein